MTRSASSGRRRRVVRPTRHASDATIYAGLGLIGLFVLALSIPLFQGHWRETLVAYLAVIAAMIQLYAWRAYASRPLAHWQKALARVPLRFVGYGGRDGRPIEAAHGHAEARRAIMVCGVVSLLIIAGLAFALTFLWPGPGVIWSAAAASEPAGVPALRAALL
jgi:hypothetical protein